MAGLGATEEMAVQTILSEVAKAGLATGSTFGYRMAEHATDTFSRLAFALDAIGFYSTAIHQDSSQATVVLTKPAQPSLLESNLGMRGWKISELEATQHAFHGLVRNAKSRVVVMTPFLDQRGAAWLKELFELIPKEVRRILILRTLEAPDRPDYPSGFDQISAWLRSVGAEVYNYSIPRVGRPGRETFHAKVLLCDDTAAYVGSSNMTGASLEYSMEMGIAATGRAATKVELVVDAVLASSTRWY